MKKLSLRFYGQYAPDINGVNTTAGYRGVALLPDGVHWRDLPDNHLMLAWPLININITSVSGYRPDRPEMAERTHVFRLAQRIGELLSQM